MIWGAAAPATAAPQAECRKTPLRTLRNTSATARVARRLAGKATRCKLAEVRRQPPRHRQALRLQVHPGGCTVNGSLDPSDPTQIDRLFRSGIPQTCPPSTTCATFGDPTARHYDAYTFTNNTGATQCVTVDPTTACTGTNFIFVAAYLGSFDPNNICTNWIGDSGISPDVGIPAPFSV